MTNGKDSKRRNSPTDQCGKGALKKIHLHSQGGQAIGATVRSFRTASIPIYSPSTESKRTATDSRKEGSFYGQAPFKPGGSSQATGEMEGGIFKCHGDRGFRTLSQESEEWAIEAVRSKFVCIISLIGWQVGNCLRYISFWFQREIFLRVKAQHI